MEIDLSEPQSEFYLSEHKYVAAVAGFGSGKTEVALLKAYKNLVECPGLDQAYLAPTYGLIRDIWYPKVDEFLSKLGVAHVINEGKNNIVFPKLRNPKTKKASTIICRTMEKPERIIGWEAADAFLDEFDVLATDKAQHVFRKVSARLRQRNPTGRKNQLCITTTPEGFKATYEYFKKNPLKDSHLIQMSTWSNAHNLPEDYIQSLYDQYPEQLIDAYLNGEFVNLQAGTVYYAFDRFKNHTSWVAKPREALLVGMDFNVTDMCATVHIKREGKLAAVDEFFGLRDTPDMCDTLREAYPDSQITIYPDASGKGTSSKSASLSDIKIIKDKGFRVQALSANPLIKNRVSSMNKQFETLQYLVNTDRCPEYTLALEQQPYDEKTGQPEKDGNLDNRVDGAGYLVHYLHPIAHRKVTSQKLGGF